MKISTKFCEATKHRGSRIKVTNGTETRYYAWRNNLKLFNNHHTAAKRFLFDIGYECFDEKFYVHDRDDLKGFHFIGLDSQTTVTMDDGY